LSTSFILILISFLLFSLHTFPPHIYTLSLHDALPIFPLSVRGPGTRPRRRYSGACHHDHPDRMNGLRRAHARRAQRLHPVGVMPDRKSTRLNSSHGSISYAVFCLKKKNKIQNIKGKERIDVNNDPTTKINAINQTKKYDTVNRREAVVLVMMIINDAQYHFVKARI